MTDNNIGMPAIFDSIAALTVHHMDQFDAMIADAKGDHDD